MLKTKKRVPDTATLVTSVIIRRMNTETPVVDLTTPVAAIQAAIAQFKSQAEFKRALENESQREISSAAISQWVLRGKGASPEFCPDIEVISGVPCEALCPKVNWKKVRAQPTPPSFRPLNHLATA